MTPFVIASRTSATLLPEKSSRCAAAPAAAPAFCPRPAALPARCRPLVAVVRLRAVLLELELELERLRDPVDRERVLVEREVLFFAVDPLLRADDDFAPERELDEREPPDDRDELDRELREEPPERRPPPEDPRLAPPVESAIVGSPPSSRLKPCWTISCPGSR
jgi:hypothetical protein